MHSKPLLISNAAAQADACLVTIDPHSKFCSAQLRIDVQEYARQTRARREAYWRMVSVQDNPVATNESETSGDQQGQATSTTLAEGAGSVTEGDGDLALSGPLVRLEVVGKCTSMSVCNVGVNAS